MTLSDKNLERDEYYVCDMFSEQRLMLFKKYSAIKRQNNDYQLSLQMPLKQNILN